MRAETKADVKLTREQIKTRLAVLAQYEITVMRNALDGSDDSEAVDNELLRVLFVRGELQRLLNNCDEEAQS